MARIPENITNEQSTSGPGNLYLRNAYSPDNFGAGVAKGMDRLGEMMFRLEQENTKDKNETAVLDAYNKAAIEKSRYLYDPEAGIYSRQGSNALDLANGFEEENRRIGESASQGLDPDAKKKFDTMWSRSAMADREGVMKHEMAQRQKYRAETGDATIDLAIANAANDYGNPDVISRSKSEIMASVMQNFNGASKETIADKVLEGYSSLHKGVVMKLAAESPSKAEQYYNSNKDEFTAADHVQVTNYLRGQIFRSKVLQDAERITATGGPVKKLYETLFEGSPQGRAIMESLTQQESGFRSDVKAYNKTRGQPDPEKTAVGLTQVLVGTAREISSELKDGIVTPDMTPKQIEKVLEDGSTNLRYGTHYLNKMLKMSGGDLEAALIGYNAGPGNMKKWLAAGRNYESLPDRAQTEPYVRNVMGMYRRNLGQSYPKTAQKLEMAGVQPSATDAQLETFRTHLDPASVGHATISPAVEDGAAKLFDVLPSSVKTSIQLAVAGTDLQVTTKDSFAKQWIMMNAPTAGLAFNESEGTVTLTSGQGPTDISPIVETQEYDLNEWLNEAAKIDDPSRREAVEKELLERHNALQKAAKQDENTLKQQAWELTLGGNEVPIEIQKRIGPQYMATLNEYNKKLHATGKIETDWAVWSSLRLKTDEELRSLGDVMQYRPHLGDTEFKTLVDMVRESRGEGDPAKKGLTSQLRTRTQIVEQTVKQHFKNNHEKIGQLNAAVDQEVQGYYDTYKKAPNPIEMQSMVDRLVIEAETVERGSTYMFDVKPGDIIEEPVVSGVADIPVLNHRAAQTNAPQLFGRRLTDEEVEWGYTAALAFKRGAYVQATPAIRQLMIEMGAKPDRVNSLFGRVMSDLFEVK